MRLITVLIFLSISLIVKYLFSPITDLLDLEKCPACYGTSLCSAFAKELISLDMSALSIILNVFGSKNVLTALYLQNKVVLKKLGSTRELAMLDDLICEGHMCKVGEVLQQHDDLMYKLKKQVSDTFGSRFLLCPSALRLEELVTYYEEPQQDRNTTLANVWTVMSVNPEPLVLQVLREQDGWPVAKYLGACGRVVVEAHAGEMLYTYHSASWTQRADLAAQLLLAAINFTLNHPDFRFYLTDVSPDNIAVDTDGKVRFIDLENVILVDKHIAEEDRSETWDIPHSSEVFDCEGDGCFAFSSADICAHNISDHNLYAVCQMLLHPQSAPSSIPGGLLHHTPASLSHIMQLVDECVNSTDRISVAWQLITALLSSSA